MDEPIIYSDWVRKNESAFSPLIGNKLMHRGGISVMFVAGPNSRRDFHVDESSEFFFQLKGSMDLVVIERGKKRVITIGEGHVLLLPPRIPHSPQRVVNSLGLVIERKRDTQKEFDCLRWFSDFKTCLEVEYEQFFACNDLGKDLVKVVNDYICFKNSGGSISRSGKRMIEDDTESVVPDAFSLSYWCDLNKLSLEQGATLNLFGSNHPDRQFQVLVSSENNRIIASDNEVYLFQIKGSASVCEQQGMERNHILPEDACFVLPVGSRWLLNNQQGLTLILSYNLDSL